MVFVAVEVVDESWNQRIEGSVSPQRQFTIVFGGRTKKPSIRMIARVSGGNSLLEKLVKSWNQRITRALFPQVSFQLFFIVRISSRVIRIESGGIRCSRGSWCGGRRRGRVI